MCCCCICQCQTKETKDLACCGCFPIKCGVYCIGIITFCLLLFLFIEIFYCLLNEYDDWWYVLVGEVLLIPLIIACTFFVVFFAKETDTTRTTLFAGCQLVLISVTLLAVWTVCYFYFFYKYDAVYTGTADLGYIKQTKKQFIVWSMFLAAAIDAVYAYFLRKTQATASESWLISGNPFDVIGAISAGMRGAWVKRTEDSIFDPWGIEPTITITSLAELGDGIGV